jgi:branched-chain amino acid transport system substrate-binding protein
MARHDDPHNCLQEPIVSRRKHGTRLRGMLMSFALVASQPAVSADASSIVIGQSLPLRSASYPSAKRIFEASRAYVEHVNKSGGVNGRKLELVTLDDADDPAQLERNMQRLAQENKAVAFVNCLGDALCERASDVSRRLSIPLIGPISGSSVIRSTDRPLTFVVRPQHEVLAQALVKQLRSIGVLRVALISDHPAGSELRSVLARAFTQAGVALPVIEFNQPGDQATAPARLSALNLQAVIVDLSDAALQQLALEKNFEWPGVLATVSTGTLTQLTRTVRSRMIGYVSVVPNPEDERLAMNRELTKLAEQHSGPEAVTFEGLEAFVNTRVAIEAIRRAKAPISPQSVARAAEALPDLDLGGFVVKIGRAKGPPSWVGIGVRSRDGVFLK